MELENLGYMFKNDPLFNFEFYHLPKGCFLEIAKRREKRLTENPQLSDIL